MSSQRIDAVARELGVSLEALDAHLWEQGVPVLDGSTPLNGAMIAASREFAGPDAAPAPGPEAPAPSKKKEASPPKEASSAVESPAEDGGGEVRRGSVVRRRRIRD